MRVLMVTNDYPPDPGGIQQYLANLVQRHEGPIRVLGPAHPGAADPPYVFRGRRSWMLPTPATRRWVVQHVHEYRPDVVIYGAPTPLAQLGPAIRTQTKVPFVVMTHGAEVTLPAVVPGLRQILAATLRAADAVFAVSRYTAARVEGLSGAKPVVLGAGVDTDLFHPAARTTGPVTIGCVSRFIPRKGHLRVIAAAEELLNRGHDIDVLIVGKGRLERRIRRRAASSQVDVRMEVDIPWEHLPVTYNQMDVFVMPARTRWAGLEIEGLGIVYLEAAASGLPVVAGASGGAPETVIPGETGYVAVRVDHIVAAVERILRRPEMSAAARTAAETEWTWDAVMDRWRQGLTRAAE